MTAALSFEQFTDVARRGQEAATATVETSTRALRTYATAVTPDGARPVDPQAATAATFDLAEQLLGAQREFVGTVVALLTQVGEAATAQASAAGETLKSRTEEAAERVIHLATETTRRAAGATRSGVSV